MALSCACLATSTDMAWGSDTAFFHRQNFGHHTHGDLRRSHAADIQVDGAAQLGQRSLGLAKVLHHAIAPGIVVAARTYGGDIKGRTVQGFEQGQIVELGVVGQGAKQLVASGLKAVTAPFGMSVTLLAWCTDHLPMHSSPGSQTVNVKPLSKAMVARYSDRAPASISIMR